MWKIQLSSLVIILSKSSQFSIQSSQIQTRINFWSDVKFFGATFALIFVMPTSSITIKRRVSRFIPVLSGISLYTLFANHCKTWTKWKFHRKNCKFAKLDKNHTTHYLSIIQSFTPESNFSLREKSLWVRHGDPQPDKPGETKWTKFCKKTFRETLRTTFYTLFVMCTNFVVSSGFCSDLRIMCSPLERFIEKAVVELMGALSHFPLPASTNCLYHL